MKAMKLALLGTAALAAASVSARADSTSDLKAQIEALNARVASLETAPAVPAGYQMVGFSSGTDVVVPGVFDKTIGPAHVISIMPTADAPAAASTVITWSGWVRGAVTTVRDTSRAVGNQYSTDVRARGEIVVSGKTDTAVGEVGARMALESAGGTTDAGFNSNAGNGGAVTTDGFWGWWKMTPNLTLGAGVDGSLNKSSFSLDAACTCYYYGTGGAVGNENPAGDPAQIRLSYADGPLSVAIALEDSNNAGDTSAIGAAGKVGYAGDMFSADVGAGYWGNAVAGGQAAWTVDGGIGVNMGTMASLKASVGMGSGFGATDDYTRASAFVKLSMADTAHAEFGLTHTWNTQLVNMDTTTFAGGLYYDPVKQLTLGLEADIVSGGATDGSYFAGLVTVFRF